MKKKNKKNGISLNSGWRERLQVPTEALTKPCTKCRAVKTLDQFNRHGTAKDGLQSWCKVCSSVGAKESHQLRQAQAVKAALEAGNTSNMEIKRVGDNIRIIIEVPLLALLKN